MPWGLRGKEHVRGTLKGSVPALPIALWPQFLRLSNEVDNDHVWQPKNEAQLCGTCLQVGYRQTLPVPARSLGQALPD